MNPAEMPAPTTKSPEEQALLDHYLRVEEGLILYGAPILLVVGTVGNALVVLVVLGRGAMRATTTSIYMVALAVLDTLLLYVGLLPYWIYFRCDVDWYSLHTSSCKALLFLLYLLVHLEAWVLVNLTMERLVAVLSPHKVKIYFSKTNAVIGLTVTTLAIMTLDLHFLWTHSLVEYVVDRATGTTAKKCADINEDVVIFMFRAWPWLDMAVASVIPFIVILVSNVIIIIRVVFKNRVNKMSAKMTSVTAMLICVSFTFLVLTLPICIYFVIMYGNIDRHSDADIDIDNANIIHAAFSILFYMNNSINFILYCVSGPRFRRELLALLRHPKVHPMHSQGRPTVSQTLP